MENAALEQELHDIGAAIAGIEVALWAAMREIFETNPAAEEMLRSTYPELLSGLSGADAVDIKARVETHMKRWLPVGTDEVSVPPNA